MSEFFSPIKVFVGGMFFLLFGFLLFPAIDQPVADLSGNTTAMAANYWGWSWLMTPGVVKWLAFGIAFLLILFFTGVAFVKRRHFN